MSQRTSKSAKKGSYSKEAFAESAKRQVGEVQEVAKDAVTSGAWIYPVQGIFYLLSHPKLITPLIPTILKAIAISLGIIAGMFTFTYLPQVAVLAFVSGPLAFVGAVPLVLGESYIILLFLSKTFLLGQTKVDLFDAVLLSKSHTALVQRGRIISPSGGGKVTQLGRAITSPLTSKFSTDGIVRYILTLPLNLIPVVGSVFFVGFNGYKAGPNFHARYFQLKGWDKQKRGEMIRKRRGAYTAFGTIATLLQLVPVIGIFFSLTSAVGAALWASDIETKSAPPASLKASTSGPSSASNGGVGQNQEVEVAMPDVVESVSSSGKDGKKEL